MWTIVRPCAEAPPPSIGMPKPDVNATAGQYVYPNADIAKMYDGVPCAADPTAMCYNQQKWQGGHWEQTIDPR